MAKLRPSFDFNSKTDSKAVLSRGTAVHAGLTDNPAFTTPPPFVDLTVFKSALDALSAAIVDAMDGGKKAIADRDHKKEVVIRMLRQLAHYVEAHCKRRHQHPAVERIRPDQHRPQSDRVAVTGDPPDPPDFHQRATADDARLPPIRVQV